MHHRYIGVGDAHHNYVGRRLGALEHLPHHNDVLADQEQAGGARQLWEGQEALQLRHRPSHVYNLSTEGLLT